MLNRMKVSRFGAIDEGDLVFSSGMNVFIGENSTGKTFALKLMYCVVHSAVTFREMREYGNGLSLEEVLAKKISSVFRPENQLGRLVRRGPGRGTARVALEFDQGLVEFSLTNHGKLSLVSSENLFIQDGLYLPSREVLSIYRGFVSSYLKRESTFDETYYDLALALGLLPVRGARAEEAASLYRPLSEHLGGKIVVRGDQFYLQSKTEGLIEAPLLAEGVRKIATLMHLIANGSLAQQTLLFWDEPEANLNPKLTKIVVDFLVGLAKNGGNRSRGYLLARKGFSG